MSGFRSCPTLIARPPISGSLRQLALENCIPGTGDVRPGFGDFVLTISDTAKGEHDTVSRDAALYQFMSEQYGWLEIVEAETRRQNNGIAHIRDLESPRHRMRRAVEHDQVIKLCDFERLRNRTKGFDRN